MFLKSSKVVKTEKFILDESWWDKKCQKKDLVNVAFRHKTEDDDDEDEEEEASTL